MRRVFGTVLPLAVLVSAAVSCGSGDGVIPVRKMERIYREMLLADQWLAENPDRKDAADTTWFYEPIFGKYGFTLNDYRKSVDYYLNDPKRYAEMLGRVEKGLREDLAAMNEKILLENRLRHEADSVSRARKAMACKEFRSFLEAFENDFMADKVNIEADSSGVYFPVPALCDTAFRGPALLIRDTAVSVVRDSSAVQAAPAKATSPLKKRSAELKKEILPDISALRPLDKR